jgi:hypothetical protein
MRLTSKSKGTEHRITVPAHDPLKIGTLSSILTGVAEYLQIEKGRLTKELFD